MSYGKHLSWKIEYDEEFAKDIKNLDRATQFRIKRYLDKLHSECSDPRERGKPLKANLSGFWRYRVGSYRILCQIFDKHIVLLHLLAIKHRSRSYSDKSVEQLIKRVQQLQKKL